MGESRKDIVFDAEVIPATKKPATAEVPPVSDSPAGSTGIEVSIRYFPLAFLLAPCRPVVVINGYDEQVTWGTHFFPRPPGHHEVEIYVPYTFWPKSGANSVRFVLPPGEIRTVNFFMWPLVFLKGSMSVR